MNETQNISDVRLFDRRISSNNTTGLPYPTEHCTELDSHANICCIGQNALIIFKTSKEVHVSLFHPNLAGISNCPIVSAALAYDDPQTGHTHMLVLHQAIYFEHLDHNLLCPMQLRMNNVAINECPKCLTTNPTNETPSLYFPKQNFRISLDLHAV
jgi:hypothetical protein